MASRHCTAVANLHLNYLRTSFQGRAGRELLVAYYRAVVEGLGACGFVAEDSNQTVAGFVCGVWAPGLVRRTMLRRQWPRLLFWGAVQAALHPTMVGNRLRGSETMTDPDSGYELRPIVVAPDARGSGLAAELVARLVLDARSRGYDYLHLFTEADNDPANTFYRRIGFREVEIVKRSDLVYIRYQLATQPNA